MVIHRQFKNAPSWLRIAQSMAVSWSSTAAEVRVVSGNLADQVQPTPEGLAGASSLGSALNELEYRICLRIIDHNPGLIALHGATVLTDCGAAFIRGPSGAGKTTLSMALAARGYRVGGDDVALLDPRTNTLRPLPRCFHLDAHSRRLLRRAGLAMPGRAL
jgi:hypothetical protein